jgi:hypothetical protein
MRLKKEAVKAPSRKRILGLLSYNAETGVFHWLKVTSNRTKIGAVAGTLCGNGYQYIRVDNKRMLSHRLAWFMFYGDWPPDQVDHINCIRSDNRISNLRLACNSENKCNEGLRTTNSSGFKGVSWDIRKKLWQATITKNYKQIHLGRFNTKALAHEAYLQAAQKLHGDFARV